MKISFSATNPCHVYDQALAVHELGHLGVFFSGYPRWRLKPPAGMPVNHASFRTVVTYAFQRMPEWARPGDPAVFRWQDRGFDRAVARRLRTASTDVLHCLPGQALETLIRARELGIPCILNHATGPLDIHMRLIKPEYDRVGLELEQAIPVPAAWTERLERELQLADWHCVASSVVRDQLGEKGVDPARVRIVPYGVDERLFHKRERPPEGPLRICFAGRQNLRKGLKYLLDALEAAARPGWELHVFGMPIQETAGDLSAYRGQARVIQHGAVAQAALADALRGMHVLVLPSVEEAFGLVVVQALQCGVPCIVSDRVGAKDLIRPGVNGSIFPSGDSAQLARCLEFWDAERGQVGDTFPRSAAAGQLVEVAREVLQSRADR